MYRREEKPGGAQGGKENFRPFDPYELYFGSQDGHAAQLAEDPVDGWG
jgi:hypothetical protein